MRKINYLLLFITLLFSVSIAGDFTTASLDTISENYLKQIPFQLEYKIIQKFPNSNAYQESIGQFYLHKKDCFRVNYPDSQILFDGTWLWSIDKINFQIIVEEFDPSSSLRLIYNVLNGNMSEYDILKVEDVEKDSINFKKIELKSKDENNFFKSMSIIVNIEKREIEDVEYVDFQGTKIVIEFIEYYSHQIDEKILFEVKNITQEDFIDLR